jgi:hypothetical protein
MSTKESETITKLESYIKHLVRIQNPPFASISCTESNLKITEVSQ